MYIIYDQHIMYTCSVCVGNVVAVWLSIKFSWGLDCLYIMTPHIIGNWLDKSNLKGVLKDIKALVSFRGCHSRHTENLKVGNGLAVMRASHMVRVNLLIEVDIDGLKCNWKRVGDKIVSLVYVMIYGHMQYKLYIVSPDSICFSQTKWPRAMYTHGHGNPRCNLIDGINIGNNEQEFSQHVLS